MRRPDLGARIKERRERRAWTQEHLAQAAALVVAHGAACGGGLWCPPRACSRSPPRSTWASRT